MTLMPQEFVNTWKRVAVRSLRHQPRKIGTRKLRAMK